MEVGLAETFPFLYQVAHVKEEWRIFGEMLQDFPDLQEEGHEFVKGQIACALEEIVEMFIPD